VKHLASILALLTVACGGSESTGPRDADVLGTWILSFSTNNSCSLSQIAVILTESPTGAPTGTHGSYVFDCADPADDETVDPGAILGWQVSGNDFSLQFSNTPPRRITGTVDGSTMSGSFLWKIYGGTFTAVKQ
jgi:hypothetical protein